MKHMVFLVVCVLAAGCNDSSGSGSAGDDMMTGGQMAAGDTTTQPNSPPSLIDNDPSSQSSSTGSGQPNGSMTGMNQSSVEAKYVETTLEPRRPLYRLGDTPKLVSEVLDRLARPIPNHPVRIRVFPDGAGQVDEQGRLSFNREGAGSVRVCATDQVCGRVNFFVDDGAPKLVIHAPARGAFLMGEPAIEVAGQTDSDGGTRVFVNDFEVEIDGDGKFATSIPAEFGLNRIDVVADDGVRRPSVRAVREVLWAPRYVEPNDAVLPIDNTVLLRVDASLFDGGGQMPEADANGVVVAQDLARVIEALLARADLFTLINNPQLAQNDDLNFAVRSLRTGQPDVNILITESGLEVFFRLDQAVGVFEGGGFFAGQEVDLDGEITLSLAAFARFNVSTDDEFTLTLTLDEIGVAVERLSARMNSELAQAAVEGAASLVRGVINQFGSDLISDLIANQLASVIEVGLKESIDPLRNISLSQEAQPPVPALDLAVSLNPKKPEFSPRGHIQLGFDGTVGSSVAFQSPHMSPGVPSHSSGGEPPWPAESQVAAGIQLVALNGLMDSLWRQKVLQLDLSDAVPMGLFGIVGARIDGRLPPIIVPGRPGATELLELQVGELDLLVDVEGSNEPAKYIVSIRVGLDLRIVDGVVTSTVAESIDVRVEFAGERGAEAPVPSDLVGSLVEGQIGEQLVNSLSDALRFEVPDVSIGLDTLGGWVPSISRIELKPSWPDKPKIKEGWLMLLADAAFHLVP